MSASVNKKLPHFLIAVGFVFVTLLLLLIIALWKFNTFNGLQFEQALQEHHKQQHASVQLLNAAYQRALSLHMMTIADDPFVRDAMFIKFRDFGQQLIINRDYLNTSNTSEAEWEIWEKIRDTLNEGGRIQYGILDAMDAGQVDVARKLLADELPPVQNQLQQNLHQLSEVKEKILLRQRVHMQRTDSKITILMYSLGLVASILGLFTYHWIRQSTSAESELLRQTEQFRSMCRQSLRTDLSSKQQIREMMQLLCRYLGMDSAKLSKVDRRRRTLTYVEVVDLTGALTEMERDNVVSMDKTMSGICLVENTNRIVLHEVARSIYAKRDLYESSNTGSFIGMSIMLSGQVYGSLSFYRHHVRAQAFSNMELDSLQLAIEWIGITLQSEHYLNLKIENRVNEKSTSYENQFYGNMNHELRTPLNAIIGYSELLLSQRGESASDDVQQQSDEILRKIRQSGHHLLSLVDNILDLTRLGSGKMNLSPQEFEVMPTINAVIESLEYFFLQANTRFMCNQYIGSMVTDKEKFQQILQNLIESICQYSRQSELTMKISEQRENATEYLVFSLRSNVDMQNLASKLLDIVNGSARRQWDYGRLEVGFSLCHKFSKLLGGDLSVREESGQSTEFYLKLPKYYQVESTLANVI